MIVDNRLNPQRNLFFPACQGSGIRLGLGGAPLGNLFASVSNDEATHLIAAALADGCRSFDTAPRYGHGLSERRLGDGLRDAANAAPESFLLSSKVGRLLVPNASASRTQHGYVDILLFDQRWDFTATGIRRSVEDSLQRMGLAHLDVVYVHDPDAPTHGEHAPAVLRQLLDEAWPALQQLKKEGRIGAVGLGTNDVQIVLDVMRGLAARGAPGLDVLMLAGRYSLLDHSALAELLPQCVVRGVRTALGGVFNSGILARGTSSGPVTFNYESAAQEWVDRTRRIETVCQAHQVPLRAAALQFPLAHPAVDIVMLGARNVAEWRDALVQMQHPIAPSFWQDLRAEKLIPTEAPVPGSP
jgi:D-threo-aldose 1-dehydrogenase